MDKWTPRMNPNLEKQMRYHLQEIMNRLDHFAPKDEDLDIMLTVKIGGKKYWQESERRHRTMIGSKQEF